MRLQRWVILSFVITGILAGMVVQSAAVSGFAQFAFPDTRVGPVTLSTVLAAATGGIVMLALLRNERIVSYSMEVVTELTKVTWPDKEETIRASTTVVVTTALVAALLGAYDFVWKNLADFVLLTSS